MVIAVTGAGGESAFMAAMCKDKTALTYHGHPSDCNKFFVCLDRRPFIMDCPYNLHFDAQHIICKAPGEVQCHHPMPSFPHDHFEPHFPSHPTHHEPHFPHHPVPHTTTKKPKRTTKKTTRTTTTSKPEFDDETEEEEEQMRVMDASPTASKGDNQVECCHFYTNVCWDC